MNLIGWKIFSKIFYLLLAKLHCNTRDITIQNRSIPVKSILRNNYKGVLPEQGSIPKYLKKKNTDIWCDNLKRGDLSTFHHFQYDKSFNQQVSYCILYILFLLDLPI